MIRRDFLRLGALWSGVGRVSPTGMLGVASIGGGLALPGQAAATDYRALVCVHLSGGNDGNNSLIPLDGAYDDYASARPDLALAKDSLTPLSGNSAGHAFGLNPALAPLAALYNQQRLAWVVNVGPLVVPTTAGQVKDRSVPLPPFLFSHSDQIAIQQGWMGDTDASGWAGRALEAMPSRLKNPLSAVTTDNNRTLVLGRHSRVGFMSPGGSRWWGQADLASSSNHWARSLGQMSQWQYSNRYETEFTRSFGSSFEESKLLTQAYLKAQLPVGNFPSDSLGESLRSLAAVMPVFKSMGFKRQIFLISWGGFDTHTDQRGSNLRSQDTQLDVLARAMSAFDQANLASGLGADVTSLMMTDFGRTLRQASGGGSDHGWGNHWFVMGGSVAGGQVIGEFPALVLRGPDDADPAGQGRFVPKVSSDQLGATLMQWMGLPTDSLLTVFPNLANFSIKNLGLFST